MPHKGSAFRATALTSLSMSFIFGSMTEEEFTRRFTQAIIRTAFQRGKLPFGRDPGKYAAGVVQAYWREHLSNGGAPERYARVDASFWEKLTPPP